MNEALPVVSEKRELDGLARVDAPGVASSAGGPGVGLAGWKGAQVKQEEAEAATNAARLAWKAKRVEHTRGRGEAILERIRAAAFRREFWRKDLETLEQAEAWAVAVERAKRSQKQALEERIEGALEDAWVAAAAAEAGLTGRIEVKLKPETK